MLKFVKNVTSTDYILTGEINTPNGVTPITIRIIRGGLYEIDTHIRYNNLEKAISDGSLVPLLEDQTVAPAEVVEDIKSTPTVTEVTVEDSIVFEETNESADDVIEELTAEEVSGSTEESVGEGSLICPYCGAECATKSSLTRHINKYHPEQ